VSLSRCVCLSLSQCVCLIVCFSQCFCISLRVYVSLNVCVSVCLCLSKDADLPPSPSTQGCGTVISPTPFPSSPFQIPTLSTNRPLHLSEQPDSLPPPSLFFVCFATSRNLWVLSSPMRDQTQVPGSGSLKS